MDPISQTALGAIAARSVAPADMVKGVLIAGAALGAAPDIDVVFSIGGDFFDSIKHHRGVTHSLIVLLAAGPLAGHWLWRRFGAGRRWRRQHLWWLAVATVALLSHPVLDWLTPYGTQLLAPFSDQRFAVNAMPIIDPVYTLILLGGLAAAAWLKSPRHRKASALVALALSCAYLAYGWAQNREAAQFAAAQLEAEGLADYELSAFPTILQVHYRRLVVRTPSEVRVGYFSTWSPCAIEWGRAPRSAQAIASALAHTEEGRAFDWFTMGWSYPAVRQVADGFQVTLSDLRYGATLDPSESFFSIGARFDAAGRLFSPPTGRGFSPDRDRLDLQSLFNAAYAPECAPAAVTMLPGQEEALGASAFGIHGCKSAPTRPFERSISSNMAGYSPQSPVQRDGGIGFSLSRLPKSEAPGAHRLVAQMPSFRRVQQEPKPPRDDGPPSNDLGQSGST